MKKMKMKAKTIKKSHVLKKTTN